MAHYDDLKNKAQEVRNEVKAGANTATRVGAVLEGIVDVLETQAIQDAHIQESIREIQNGTSEELKNLVVNDLTTGGADKALSAEMGKVLGEELTELESEVSELDFVVNGAEIEAFVDVTDEITTTENEIGKLLPRYYIQGFDGFLGYTNGGNAYVYKTQEGDVWKAENLSVGGNKSRCWGVYSDDSIAEGNRALNNIVQMDSDNTGNRANVSSGEITIQSGCKYIAFCVWGTDKPIIYKKKKIGGESLLGKINKLNNTILSLDGYVNEFDVMIKDFKA